MEVESLIDGGHWQMSQIQFERKWIAQCEAPRRLKTAYFAEVVSERSTVFVQELPDYQARLFGGDKLLRLS